MATRMDYLMPNGSTRHWESPPPAGQAGLHYPPPEANTSYMWQGPPGVIQSPYSGHSKTSSQHSFAPMSSITPEPSDHSAITSRSESTPLHSHVMRTSRSKGNKRAKVTTAQTELPGPISRLAADSHVDLFDIEKYVHRSTKQRLQEKEANKGKIKRPMNSYIMYRKVYQERVKEYAQETNHQIISRLVSSSWEQESASFKERFAEYARIERDNLMKAFPTYKFQPRTKNATSRRKKDDAGSDEEGSDLDGDPTWQPRGGRRVRAANVSPPPETVYQPQSRNATPAPAYIWEGEYYRPEAAALAPMRPSPVPLSYDSGLSGYYPTHMMPQTITEDGLGHVMLAGTHNGMDGYRLSGLPGMGDTLLSMDPNMQVDPMLREPWPSGPFTTEQFDAFNSTAVEAGPRGYHAATAVHPDYRHA